MEHRPKGKTLKKQINNKIKFRCALQLIAPEGGCHQCLFIARCTPALPTPSEQSDLVPHPDPRVGQRPCCASFGSSFRRSGRFRLFSREEWSGHHGKAPTTLAHWDAEMPQPALSRGHAGRAQPQGRGRRLRDRKPRPALAGQSREGATRPRPTRSRCRAARRHHRWGSGQRSRWGRPVHGDRWPRRVLASACVSKSISTCSDSPRPSVRWHFQGLHSVSSWGHTRWSRAGRWLPHRPHYTCLLMSALYITLCMSTSPHTLHEFWTCSESLRGLNVVDGSSQITLNRNCPNSPPTSSGRGCCSPCLRAKDAVCFLN